MRSNVRILLPILAAGVLLIGLASETLGQSRGRGRGGRPATRDPILKGNPRRDIGGSCVYDRDGKVVFAPNGVTCRDGTDHLTAPTQAKSPVLTRYPPALRKDLSELLGDHAHLKQEIARARRAIETRNPDLALAAMNKLGEEFASHRVREERFLERVAPTRRAP